MAALAIITVRIQANELRRNNKSCCWTEGHLLFHTHVVNVCAFQRGKDSMWKSSTEMQQNVVHVF